MRKILFGVVFLVFLLLFLPEMASAHFLAVDGEINAILHVDPNDSPIPGEKANLYFLIDYGGSKKIFYLNQCNCVVTISKEGKRILKQQLIDKNNPNRSTWGANVPFVFPERDVYQITLSGKPLPKYAFQPFTVSWNFRVDEYASISPPALQLHSLQKQSDPSFFYFVIGFFSIILFTIAGIFLVKRF